MKVDKCTSKFQHPKKYRNQSQGYQSPSHQNFNVSSVTMTLTHPTASVSKINHSSPMEIPPKPPLNAPPPRTRLFHSKIWSGQINHEEPREKLAPDRLRGSENGENGGGGAEGGQSRQGERSGHLPGHAWCWSGETLGSATTQRSLWKTVRCCVVGRRRFCVG